MRLACQSFLTAGDRLKCVMQHIYIHPPLRVYHLQPSTSRNHEHLFQTRRPLEFLNHRYQHWRSALRNRDPSAEVRDKHDSHPPSWSNQRFVPACISVSTASMEGRSCFLWWEAVDSGRGLSYSRQNVQQVSPFIQRKALGCRAELIIFSWYGSSRTFIAPNGSKYKWKLKSTEFSVRLFKPAPSNILPCAQ